jgi:phage-related protein
MNVTSSIFNAIGGVVGGIGGVVSEAFNNVAAVVGEVMNGVGQTVTNIFDGIQNAWSGLTSFVSGVFDGVASAVSELVSSVKGFVNDVIGGINGAIDVINKIPGVSIGSIPYLQSGSTSFQGGFALMNEGGRGEMVVLPSGSQVIPHDASMKYAKEAAKRNANTNDYDGNESVIYDYRGMNDGAMFVVREEADIDKIALALQKRQERADGRRGIRK